jgi:hypothetical protein
MNVYTAVTLPLGGKDRRFYIGSFQILHMERGTRRFGRDPAALGAIYARLLRGRYEADGEAFGIPSQAEWKSSDLDEVIYYGLVGGGETESDTDDLMREHVAKLPMMERWNMAVAILGACIEGRAEVSAAASQ